MIKTATQVVVDCNGVGYDVQISLNTYADIEPKSSGMLFTYHLVREDAQESGCEAGLELLKTILSRGTSAHPQTAIFDVAITTRADKQSTLYSVVTF